MTHGAPTDPGNPAPFTLSAPLDGGCPLILASAHSGQHVPRRAAQRIVVPPGALRRIEDALVDRLVAPAAHAVGAPLIAATHARAVIDLNRAEDEYDPAMIAGPMLRPAQISDRVRRGYGLVPRIAATSTPIHAGRIPAAEVEARIAALHRPWHGAIAAGLAAAHRQHGHALLIDCHSMPRLPLPQRADVVVGDGHGRCAAPALVAALADLLRQQGLSVVANTPYAGGHGVWRHGRPGAGIHAVQLEFCRSLYLDRATLTPGAGFDALARSIRQTMAGLLPMLPDLLGTAPLAQAAE